MAAKRLKMRAFVHPFDAFTAFFQRLIKKNQNLILERWLPPNLRAFMDLQAMIIAIYARVSTSDQSCEMQLYELRQYVAKQGWQVFAEYVDAGFSGAAASG
jgi:Resolvase, N terminal domain